MAVVLSVLLFLLKLLAILLFVIVFLLVAAILILLFVPIHYRVSGEKHEHFLLQFQVDWLLRAFRVEGTVDERGLRYRAKALWMTLRENNDEGTA